MVEIHRHKSDLVRINEFQQGLLAAKGP
jgi:hypothetical protein